MFINSNRVREAANVWWCNPTETTAASHAGALLIKYGAVMSIGFNEFFQRLRRETTIASQMDMARALGVNRSAVTQAKNRNAVPSKWVLALSRHYSLSPDWLEFGTGVARSAALGAPDAVSLLRRAKELQSEAGGEVNATGPVLMVPKVQARLCAGAGSMELEAVPVSEHPFPLSWLSRMGTPSAMVFMDVIGDSMEPDIKDGDMVLVDQSVTALTPKVVMAVGYEDAIYIKRLEKRPQGLALLSDNQEYAPLTIRGDEMDTFRVIGKVVWLCRDCRFA